MRTVELTKNLVWSSEAYSGGFATARLDAQCPKPENNTSTRLGRKLAGPTQVSSRLPRLVRMYRAPDNKAPTSFPVEVGSSYGELSEDTWHIAPP